jgi:hypothetical protein
MVKRLITDDRKHPMLSALLPVAGILLAATLAKTGAAAHLLHLAHTVLAVLA